MSYKRTWTRGWFITVQTSETLRRLAVLKPKSLAVMHGSAFVGDCERALDDLAAVMRGLHGS